MSGVPCGKCGRFLAGAHPVIGEIGEGYSHALIVAGVRGDCARCGPGVLAAEAGRHAEWDFWDWDCRHGAELLDGAEAAR